MDGFWEGGRFVLRSTIEERSAKKDKEIAALRAKVEELEKDAARYRFLKSDGGRQCKIELMEQSEEDGEFYGVTLIKGDYIDAAIDAAMNGE